jgi:hypothetical protein
LDRWDDTDEEAIAAWNTRYESKDFARGFDKGRIATLIRKNSSGCTCVFNEDDELESICDAHQEWLEVNRVKKR